MTHRFSKKTKWILLAILLVLLAALLLPALVRRDSAKPSAEEQATTQPAREATAQLPTQEAEMKGNLMAWTQTREDAEQLASLYGITLVMYSDHLALFETDKDPDELIQTGKKNGWPELSKNNSVTISQP